MWPLRSSTWSSGCEGCDRTYVELVSTDPSSSAASVAQLHINQRYT